MSPASSKRVLKDETSKHNNSEPNVAKKRKLEEQTISQRNKKLETQVPASSFEEDLAKITQDIEGLKDGMLYRDTIEDCH